MHYIASLSIRTHSIVLILVDENMPQVTVLEGAQRWIWHKKLKRTPILYGFWHPYKYLVTNAWRRFHSLFVYFRFGRLGLGTTVGMYPKMRVMGRTIAGILKCTPPFLLHLGRKSNRLQAVADHGPTAKDRLKSVVCKAMVKLLQNWCPLVLYCGFLVRRCNWSKRHPGSAFGAHHVL